MSTLTFTGTLDADAQNRATTDGEHLLQFTLRLPVASTGKPLLVRATQRFGTGPAAAIACRSRAHSLRRNVRVTVSARAIGWLRGVAQLEGVDYVHTPDIPLHRGLIDA